MKTFIETASVPVSDLMHLNRLQHTIVAWASEHSNEPFFQTFFQELTGETERFYLKLTGFSPMHREPAELNALKAEWQGLLNTAAVRTKGMRSSDFFKIIDKLFALEAKALKTLLKLYGLDGNLRRVLEVHSKEITLLREAMTYLEQYETIFESGEVPVQEANEQRTYLVA
jgi:DNA repair ATPase RecN